MSEPMVNVNLSTNCGCIGPNPGFHLRGCSATAVNIPCPLPPSVEMKVVLGECMCQKSTMPSTRHWHPNEHPENCPARPVRVTCSISGETWAKSEVTDAWPGRDDGYLCSTCKEFPTLLEVCRDLWALVKALVTDGDAAPYMLSEAWAEKWDRVAPLFAQRDAVFSALCEMARAEFTIIQRFADLDKVFTNRNRRAFHGCAADEFLAYVTRLIEQVGALVGT